ncbi:MAG: FAD-dependent oxidoreductase [Blautia sp.]|nr:FAD-dependent oxidoreductase [Blautia sp.]
MKNKKYLALGLSLAACLSVSCLAEEVYTGSAHGMGSDVTCEVTLSDGKVVGLTVDDSGETYQSAGVESIQPLVDAILENGTTEGVEGVSGATLTSNAILTVVNEALAGGKAEAPAEVSFTPGTYTQSAMGRNAMVEVAVTFDEASIQNVEITDHAETEAVASIALERIPESIVENQTTKIDAVTGATVTSNAILSAVNAAIKEAGADPSALPEAYLTAGEAWEDSADVIVVGGGGAGMAATISALEGGSSVILVEKTSMLGGNTVLCGGALNAADTEWASQFDAQTGEDATLEQLISMDEAEIAPEYLDDFHTLQEQVTEYLAGDTSKHFDSVELHTLQTYLHGMRTSLDGDVIYGNYELVSNMTRHAMDTVNWLADLGIQWQDAVTQPVGGMWRRGHNPSMIHGEEYVAVLGKHIEEAGGIVLLETTAKSLISEDGKVVGVEAEQADGTKVTLHAAKAVILTTGGYANNLAMVQETNNYWPNIPENTGTTNASGMKGEGILMAQEVGAATNGMEFTQLMAVSDPETGDLFTGLLPQSTADYIMVNQEGNRFVNECSARDTLAIAAFDNGGLFYMIADIDIAEDARWLSDWETEVERGNTIMADTLEELADKLGFDETAKANFLQAMENYNSYVDAGEDQEFQKNSLNEKVDNAPFFASPRKPALHHTMGGLTIDTAAHVLNEEGSPIEGLYAAGEVCGGIHAGNRLGGNAVADAFVYGRIAGENASAEE